MSFKTLVDSDADRGYQKAYERLILDAYKRMGEEAARDKFHGSSIAAKVLDELGKEEMYKTKKSEIEELKKAKEEITRLREIVYEQEIDVQALKFERDTAYGKLNAIKEALTKEKV